jgi:hypothetical protein
MKRSKKLKAWAITVFLRVIARHVAQHPPSYKGACLLHRLIQPVGKIIAKELRNA